MSRSTTFILLVLCVACETEEELGGRGREGKADVHGSCAGTACDGQSPTGTCWCDPDCALPQNDDCCADREMICGGSSGPADGGGAAMVPELGADPDFEVVATASDGLDTPRDLAFHPTRTSELWVLNQGSEGILIVWDPGKSTQREELRVDVMHDHFMSQPSSLAFGASNTFGSCQESLNHGNHFMGPTLWSADLSIFAAVNQESSSPLLGSHLDMLHQSPLCMGIEHDSANKYWVFDGAHGHVVYYDFRSDHGPGYDDHADGIVRRYPEARVRRRSGVPGHMVLDDSSDWLYIADTGNNRVLRLDTDSGSATTLPSAENEPLAEYSAVVGTTEEVFASGIGSPSGIALANGRLFVGSFASGEIIAFDLSGNELGRVQTGASGLMGLTYGQGKLWFVDAVANRVVRIDP
jgi:hypothetical protein